MIRPAAIPALATARLRLRPFTMSDAPRMRELAGDWAIADTTLNIPHPYALSDAIEWIREHRVLCEQGRLAAFAIERQEDSCFLGCIGLSLNPRHHRGELGYWVGRPYWNRGYCSEAGRAVVRYGFEALGLHRIHARHMVRNPASGRVLRKLGMREEGRLREHVQKWGKFEDLTLLGLLRREWEEGEGKEFRMSNFGFRHV